MTICKYCGCNLEVEREVFGGDKLFTGHSCFGSHKLYNTKEQFIPCGLGANQEKAWDKYDSTPCYSLDELDPAPDVVQDIGRN